MNITITGRHINISEKLKEYAEKKLQKIGTYFTQLIDAHIIMYIEKLDHGAEVIINGDGIQFHGREKAADLYSAIDLLMEKMEKQIVKYKERHSAHKGPGKGETPFFELTSTEGMNFRLNLVSNKPLDKIEAYLQMKLDRKKFILFKKGVSEVDTHLNYSNKNYAVIYLDQNVVKMVEIPFEKIKENKFEHRDFIVYDLNVIDDSMTNPKIDFKKNSKVELKKLSIDEAIGEMEKAKMDFLPFFNVESQYFNVIYRNGKGIEIAVPAF